MQPPPSANRAVPVPSASASLPTHSSSRSIPSVPNPSRDAHSSRKHKKDRKPKLPSSPASSAALPSPADLSPPPPDNSRSMSTPFFPSHALRTAHVFPVPKSFAPLKHTRSTSPALRSLRCPSPAISRGHRPPLSHRPSLLLSLRHESSIPNEW